MSEEEIIDWLNDPKRTPEQVAAFYKSLPPESVKLVSDIVARSSGEESRANIPYDEYNTSQYENPYVMSDEGPLAHEREAETVYKMDDTQSVLEERHQDYFFRDRGEGIEYRKVGEPDWYALDPAKWELKDFLDLKDELIEGTGSALLSRVVGSLAAGAATTANPAIAGWTAPAAYTAGSAAGNFLGGLGTEGLRQGRSLQAGYTRDLDPTRAVAQGAVNVASQFLPFGSSGATAKLEKQLMEAGVNPRSVTNPIQQAISKSHSALAQAAGSPKYSLMEQGKKYIPDVKVLKHVAPDAVAETSNPSFLQKIARSLGMGTPDHVEKIPGVATLQKNAAEPLLSSTKALQSDVQKALSASEDHIWGRMDDLLGDSIDVDLTAPRQILKAKINQLKIKQKSNDGFIDEADKNSMNTYQKILDDFFLEKGMVEEVIKTPDTAFEKSLKISLGRPNSSTPNVADKTVSKKVTRDIPPLSAKEATKKRTRIRQAMNDQSLPAFERRALQEVYGEMTHAIENATESGFQKKIYDGISVDETFGPIPINKKLSSDYKKLNLEYAQTSALRRNLEEYGLSKPDFDGIVSDQAALDLITNKRTKAAADRLMNMGIGVKSAKKEGLQQDLDILDQISKKLPESYGVKPYFKERGNVISALKTWQNPDVMSKQLPSMMTSGLGGIALASGFNPATAPTVLGAWGAANVAGSPWLQKKFVRGVDKFRGMGPVLPNIGAKTMYNTSTPFVDKAMFDPPQLPYAEPRVPDPYYKGGQYYERK